MALEFPGKDILIDRINSAVSGDCPYEITTCLRKSLCDSIADKDICLPDVVFEPIGTRYARREIHQDEKYGYSVIAMTWGPGQGTPIHDHGGMWCVEGVWSGCIEIVQYNLLAQEPPLYRFESVGTIMAGCGSAGSLIPPHEYHMIRNRCDETPAVTVHIYSGPMVYCRSFNEDRDGWHREEIRTLSLD